MGWIHSIYFCLHSAAEITQRRRGGGGGGGGGGGATVADESPSDRRGGRGGHSEHGQNCPGHYFLTLYVSIYNIFPYFLYILSISLSVVTFCSNNRGFLWLSGTGGVWGGGGVGGSNYILERCLHISKSYVSCL